MDDTPLPEVFRELRKSPYNFSEESLRLGIKFNFCCTYCDCDLLRTIEDYDSWQNDHIVPIAKGGGNEITNKALACKLCNFAKNDFDERELVDLGMEPDKLMKLAREYVLRCRDQKRANLDRIRELLVQAKLISKDRFSD